MPLNPHTQAVHICEDINQEAKSNPHHCDILGIILNTNVFLLSSTYILMRPTNCLHLYSCRHLNCKTKPKSKT